MALVEHSCFGKEVTGEVAHRHRDLPGWTFVGNLDRLVIWAALDHHHAHQVALRIAHRVAALLGEKDSASIVQAWFQGGNPLLDDVAPARLLRDSERDIAGPSVMAAARAFAANPENPRTNRGTNRGTNWGANRGTE